MTIPAADRVVLDTNVLLAATDLSRATHERAVSTLELWPAGGVTLYTSAQILREYLSVATRPIGRNGLGLSAGDAAANVRTLRARLTLLVEDRRVTDRLLTLVDSVGCSGEQVHDANIVATMLVHGIGTIVTSNTDDFTRFRDHVGVVDVRG